MWAAIGFSVLAPRSETPFPGWFIEFIYTGSGMKFHYSSLATGGVYKSVLCRDVRFSGLTP